MAKGKIGRKLPYKLVGGPFDGATVWLCSGSTLVFKVPSYSAKAGRYIKLGGETKLYWEEVK